MSRQAKIEELRARHERRRVNLRAGRAIKAKRSLAEFTRQAIDAGELEGIRRVEWGPHLDAFCTEVQMQLEAWLVANGFGDERMIARQREAWERTDATWEDGAPEPWLRYVLVQNALANLAPGTLKSTIAMVCANAWIWLWCPTFSFGALSGIDANVTRDSAATRDLVQSRWYRETFGITWASRDLTDEERAELDAAEDEDGAELRVRRDKNAIGEWATTAGGKRMSRTLSRGLTGLHVDGVFLDDPDDADRVWSEPERVRSQNRWTRACESRVNDEHRSIRFVLQQVVHAEGFSAYLLSISRWSPANPKGWAQFCLPAEFGFGPPDAPEQTPWGTRDWRTEKGESLHRRLSPGVLANKRQALGSIAYEAQFNQNARAITSGIFARSASRFFIIEGTPIGSLGRRPEGCPTRSASPPIVVRLDQLRPITLSVDAANSLDPNPAAKKKISAVGLMVIGELGEQRLLLEDATRVLGASATYQAIYDLLRGWPIERLLVENKALGNGVIAEIQKAIRLGWYVNDQGEQVPLRGPDGKPVRCTIEDFDPGRDSKDQRAMAMLPSWEQGLILFRDGAEWLHEKVDANRRVVDEGTVGEICGFPHARRRDRMDTLAQVVANRRGAIDVREQWRLLGGA